MSRSARSLFAIVTAISGGVALLTAVIFLRGPLLEECHLRDLEIYHVQRSKLAAEWFGVHGAARALRRLADLTRKLSILPDAEDPGSSTCNVLVRIGQAMEMIAANRRGDVVPALVTLLKEKPPYPPPGNQVRIGAANCLARIGPEAGNAVPALRESLDDDYRFRRCVSEALKRIQDDG
jgi:hypothetical protein